MQTESFRTEISVEWFEDAYKDEWRLEIFATFLECTGCFRSTVARESNDEERRSMELLGIKTALSRMDYQLRMAVMEDQKEWIKNHASR